MSYIYCLVGASASGKSTLVKSSGLPELVSTTTRNKRQGEIDGVHYNFIGKQYFNKTDYVEWTEYSGNYYGLSKDVVEKALNATKDHIVVVDIHGYHQMRYKYGNRIIGIYVESSLIDNLVRMIRRGDKLKEVVNRVKHSIKTNEYENAKYLQYKIDNSYSLTYSKIQLKNIINKKKIYLSGLITIEKSLDVARSKFKLWQDKLEGYGYEVINPFDLEKNVLVKDWEGYMIEDLTKLMRNAEGIFFIDDDITQSRGCMIELYVAQILQIPIFKHWDLDLNYSEGE
jgi:guanylate kinase